MGYHLSAEVISRGKGQSIVAKAAYNSRESIGEERTLETKDYSRMRDKPLASFVFASDPELRDAAKLWNFYDSHETRKNAITGVNFVASLPHELTDEQREFIVKDFCREQFQRKGVAAQADIHRPDSHGDERNFHVHILASMRQVSKDGLGEKVFRWEDKEKNLSRWREAWAERGANELEKQGFSVEAERWRYGHLTNAQQREKALQRGDVAWAEIKAQEATQHLGPAASGMERRGEQSDRGDLNRAVKNINDLNAERNAIDGHIAAEKAKLDRPPKTREEARERADAMNEYIGQGMREGAPATRRNAFLDAQERDGYQSRQRTSRTRYPSPREVGAEFWDYWRERVLGSRERHDEEGELER